MRYFLVPILSLAVSASLQAAATLHPLFADHAVLQRDVPLPIFGSAKPGEKIKVSFGNRTVSAVADSNGQWKVQFPAAPANKQGQVLEARGEEGEPARATDILLGDVWLLGGQSNMRRPFKTYSELKNLTANYNDPGLRLVIINEPGRQSKVLPELNTVCQGTWQPAGRPCLDEFGPTGYYFGAELRKEMGIPVGLVLSAVGGTQIELWLPPAEAAKAVFQAFFDKEPSSLYNGMIAPLRGFAFRGVAWYQGESNSRDPLTYGELMKALITGWRRELGLAERPFLMVQLAPFTARHPDSADIASWAWLRDQQAQVAHSLPKVGMVVTLDLGEGEDIHPQNKMPVGKRLALWALQDAGRKVQAASPQFKSQAIQGATIRLAFSQTGGGLEARSFVLNRKKNLPTGTDPDGLKAGNAPVGFHVCGADGVFHPATARIEGEEIVLTSPEVSQPKAVRYAWENFPLANVFGRSGLPLEPFRTDTFPAPDFGLPARGVAAPEELSGTPLSIVTTAKETPVGATVEIDGRQGQTITGATNPETKFKGRFVYANLPQGYVHDGKPVILSVLYHDGFCSAVKVRYEANPEAAPSPEEKGPRSLKVNNGFVMSGKGGWKLAEVTLSDAKFERHCAGSDLRLESGANKDLIIGGLSIRPAK